MRYQRKPTEIEAVQYEGNGNLVRGQPGLAPGAVPQWMWDAFEKGVLRATDGGDPVVIDSADGSLPVAPGDWIIRDANGELYPCPPHVFDAIYKPISSHAPDADDIESRVAEAEEYASKLRKHGHADGPCSPDDPDCQTQREADRLEALAQALRETQAERDKSRASLRAALRALRKKSSEAETAELALREAGEGSEETLAVGPGDPWPEAVSDGVTLPCSDCGGFSVVEHQVTDEFWRSTVTEPEARFSVVCPNCMARRDPEFPLHVEYLAIVSGGVTRIFRPARTVDWRALLPESGGE